MIVRRCDRERELRTSLACVRRQIGQQAYGRQISSGIGGGGGAEFSIPSFASIAVLYYFYDSEG